MLLAAMLAMVLAAAAPALAQTATAVAGGNATNAQYVNEAVCQNILGFVAAAQYGNVGNLNAEDDLAQSIAQEQNVSVEQVNECLNAFFATASPTATATATATAAAAAQYQYATGTATASPTATATALPPTGGLGPSSALALGAGALLVAGGLIARRIVR